MNEQTQHHQKRIERGIALTMENMVHTNNCIAQTDDKKLKARLQAKNDRRLAALDQMRQSIH
ncbi:MAG: hypothetical protein FWE32_07965 [Oscillospiraceae bacterium]|nr:hypothetical protein [Oscillospiraceae bacterium]